MTEVAKESTKAGATRLGAEDWLQAGLDLLVEEGIRGVKIPRLCERLGVTKGSFYWHFQDLDSYLGRLAEKWSEEGIRARASGDGTGMDVLQAMRAFSDPRNRDLTRAIRNWAENDERARAAIRRADQALFAGLKRSIADLGFDEDEAEVRAKILYYAGVGFAHVGQLGKRSSADDQLAATWELLTRR